MFPYHVVPLSGLMNVQMSVLLAVVVLEGALLLGHLTDAGQVMVLLGVLSFASIKVNDAALGAEFVPVVNVNVQLPFSVAVKTLPSAKSRVADVPVLPTALTVSV